MLLNFNKLYLFIAFIFGLQGLLGATPEHPCKNILAKQKLSDAEITEVLQCAQDHMYQGSFKHLSEIICGVQGKIKENSFEEGQMLFYRGWFHAERGNMPEAKEDASHILEIIPHIGNKYQATMLKIYVLNIKSYTIEFTKQSDQEEIKNAKEVLRLTDSLSPKSNEYYFQKARATYTIAFIYFNNKKLKEGEPYMKLMIDYAKKAKAPFIQIRLNKLIATYYIKKKEKEKALEYFKTADSIARKGNFLLERYYILPMIANAYNEKGEYKEAAALSQKFKVKNDSLTISKNQAYEKLSKCLKEYDSKKQRKYYLTSLGIGLLIVGLLIYFLQRKSNIENQQQPLLESTNSDDLELLVSLAKESAEAFYVKFPEVYPDLYKKLNATEPKFSSSEIKFCMYLKMKLTTKEIALYTNSTIKSVENKKYRIRKKLNISSEADIYHAIDFL